MNSQAKAVAYLDESGSKGGYLRNLTPERDDDIGVLAAIVIAKDRLDEVRDMFRPSYTTLRNVLPPQNKMHFADAFIHGAAIADVARAVREEMFHLIEQLKIPIVYEASRIRVCRHGYDQQQDLLGRARRTRTSPIKISERSSNERIEGQLMIGLSLKLDAFMQDSGGGMLDLAADAMDQAMMEVLRDAIEETKHVTSSSKTVRGWDPRTGKPVVGALAITISSPLPLDVRHVGSLYVVGKDDPLVLAVDGVANALHDHLCGLGVSDGLNRPASIAGWRLASRVYGVQDDAIEDLI